MRNKANFRRCRAGPGGPGPWPEPIVQNEPICRPAGRDMAGANCAKRTQLPPDGPGGTGLERIMQNEANLSPNRQRRGCEIVQNEPNSPRTGRAGAGANRAKRSQFVPGWGGRVGESCETKPIRRRHQEGQVLGGKEVMVTWTCKRPGKTKPISGRAGGTRWAGPSARNKANWGGSLVFEVPSAK